MKQKWDDWEIDELVDDLRRGPHIQLTAERLAQTPADWYAPILNQAADVIELLRSKLPEVDE